MATVTKGVRLDAAELEAVERLLRRFKHYRSESDLLYHACMRGLRDLAIEAGGSGDLPYAGFDPNELADDAEHVLLRVSNFLAARGRVPALLTQLAPAAPTSVAPEHPERPDAPQFIRIEESAADDVADLSGGFLDD